jgi:hypothetical protein
MKNSPRNITWLGMWVKLPQITRKSLQNDRFYVRITFYSNMDRGEGIILIFPLMISIHRTSILAWEAGGLCF